MVCYGSIAIMVTCKYLKKIAKVTQVLGLVIQSIFVLTSLITRQITHALNSILMTYFSRLFLIPSYIGAGNNQSETTTRSLVE